MKRNKEAFNRWITNKKIGRPKQKWNEVTKQWEKEE